MVPGTQSPASWEPTLRRRLEHVGLDLRLDVVEHAERELPLERLEPATADDPATPSLEENTSPSMMTIRIGGEMKPFSFSRGTQRGTQTGSRASDGKEKPSDFEGFGVGHEGLEPSANGLRVHCSTN